MIILVSLLVCLAGLLTYALSTNPKVAEIGRIAYGCGLLATLFAVVGHKLAFLS